MTPEETLKAYESSAPTAEQTIRSAITAAYKNLEPELRQIRTYENQQLPEFYNTFTSGYGLGTSASDLSPAQKLALAASKVAQQSTNAQTARDILGVRKASLEDLVTQGNESFKTGYGAAQNAWDRYFKEKQLAEQQRQFNASQASSASGINWETTSIDKIMEAYNKYLADKKAKENAVVTGSTPGPWSTGYVSYPTPTPALSTTSKSAANQYISSIAPKTTNVSNFIKSSYGF